MIEILIVAIMAVTNPTEHDMYVFTNPTFKTKQECVDHVQEDIFRLNMHLDNVFDGTPISNYLCIPKDQLHKWIEEMRKGDSV